MCFEGNHDFQLKVTTQKVHGKKDLKTPMSDRNKTQMILCKKP